MNLVKDVVSIVIYTVTFGCELSCSPDKDNILHENIVENRVVEVCTYFTGYYLFLFCSSELALSSCKMEKRTATGAIVL